MIDAVGKGRRPFMQRKIADKVGAASRYGLTPVLRVTDELFPFGRIYPLADETGDHDLAPIGIIR